MHLDFLYPALCLLSLQLASPALAAKPKNAILLSEVQSLTLHADRKTTHRRVSAIPQLKCISGRALCSLHKVDTMRCVNQGSGYNSEDIQWACTASLPSTLKLGSTEVICEGYASPDDPYVLKGSCGVEYRLVLTDEGEEHYPNLGSGRGGETDWSAYLFGIIFVAVAAWIVWSACFPSNGPLRQARPGGRGGGGFWGGGGGGGWGPGWGGGGGGGGGPWNDPPPPYSGTKPSDGQGWRPGFWSGLAGGAAAGYMAGNRGDRNEYYRANSPWGGNRGYGSSWGSGPSRSGSSGSSSGSNTRHESTGFGSTSRR